MFNKHALKEGLQTLFGLTSGSANHLLLLNVTKPLGKTNLHETIIEQDSWSNFTFKKI